MQIDVDGEGPALVLVHSLLTDARAFDRIVPLLADSHRLIRVSLPGFGTTPPLALQDPTVFDLASTVAEAMKQAEAGSDATVLGNGLGAFVAVALAIDHGDAFERLIVANGGACFSAEQRQAFTTMSDLVADGGMEAVVDVAVRRIFPSSYLAAHPEAVEERRAVLVRTDPGAFAAACRALRDMDLRPQLAAIANPTLVVAGEADQTTPPEMAFDLVTRVEGAELVVLRGCGHCPPLEQPEAFAAAIEGFLS